MAALLALFAGTGLALAGESTLKVGDPAPKLQTGKWIQGEPVKDFEKGKAYIVEFWATWCGPCREWEPQFERVAGHFAGQESEVVFFEINCDEDETLVGPYLAEEQPKTSVLFADGLDQLLRVNSFPTTVILDRTGKIAYRTEGFDPDSADKALIEAITRTLHPEAAAAGASR